MILISHRGNTNGKFESYENEPAYIDKAISEGFDVEIDVWMIEGVLFLGHDKPQYGVSQHWFSERYEKLWIHCKNIRTNNEFYTCPTFNEAIADGKKIKTFNIEKMWGLGTPEDLKYYLENKK